MLLLLTLWLFSLIWLKKEFGAVSLEQLMFFAQMPILESNPEVIKTFIVKVLLRSIGITSAICIVLFYFWRRKRNFFRNSCCFLAGGYFLILAVSWFYLQVSDYLRRNSTGEVGTFYEENYVFPETVTIGEPEEKQNLILIYVESMEVTYSDVNIFGEDYIAPLTQLSKDNLTLGRFEQMNYVGHTIAGIVGTQAGIPLMSNSSIISDGNKYSHIPVFLPKAYSLGQILEKQGYKNFYFSGSSIRFAGTDTFFRSHGFSENTWGRDELYKSEFLNEEERGGFSKKEKNWGAYDADLYQIFRKKIKNYAEQGKLFFAVMSTIDTHGPEGAKGPNVIAGKTGHPFGDILYCSAEEVVSFVEWVQAQPFGEKTTIVIIGDHLAMKNPLSEKLQKGERKIYHTLINSRKSVPNVNRQFSHFDLFPTMLESIGFEVEGHRLGLGTSLFSEEKTLLEKLGKEQLNQELGKRSELYLDLMLP